MKKKLCFSTLGAPEWTWNEILAVAKDLGYDGIELRGLEKEIYMPKAKPFQPLYLDSTKEQLQKLSLTIPCLASACDLSDALLQDVCIQEGKEYIDLAQHLGAPYIRVLGDKTPEPGNSIDVELVKKTASILGDYAKQRSVMVLIETNGFFSDTQKLAQLLNQLDHPAVGALWDVHHPFRFQGEKPAVTYRNLSQHIKHIHIKDSLVAAEGKLRYMIPGYGDLPLKEIVSLLMLNGYSGFFSLEWVKRWDLSLEEPGIVFAYYVQFMNEI